MSLLRRCLNALPGRSVELQEPQRWVHALWREVDPNDPAQGEIASIPKGREVQVSSLNVDAVRPWGSRNQGAGETASLGDSTEGQKMSEAEWAEKAETGIDATLAERGARYGDFDEHARITQQIKSALVSGRSWSQCTPSQKECLEMLAHKMGRIVNGDPTYLDSWVDIIGYTRLVEKQMEGGHV